VIVQTVARCNSTTEATHTTCGVGKTVTRDCTSRRFSAERSSTRFSKGYSKRFGFILPRPPSQSSRLVDCNNGFYQQHKCYFGTRKGK